MKVTVVRSGGFAGIERRAESDSASDPMLTRLVHRVDLKAVPPPGRIPDQFVHLRRPEILRIDLDILLPIHAYGLESQRREFPDTV